MCNRLDILYHVKADASHICMRAASGHVMDHPIVVHVHCQS
jgi:hypothetical protein